MCCRLALGFGSGMRFSYPLPDLNMRMRWWCEAKATAFLGALIKGQTCIGGARACRPAFAVSPRSARRFPSIDRSRWWHYRQIERQYVKSHQQNCICLLGTMRTFSTQTPCTSPHLTSPPSPACVIFTARIHASSASQTWVHDSHTPIPVHQLPLRFIISHHCSNDIGHLPTTHFICAIAMGRYGVFCIFFACRLGPSRSRKLWRRRSKLASNVSFASPPPPQSSATTHCSTLHAHMRPSRTCLAKSSEDRWVGSVHCFITCCLKVFHFATAP